MDPNPAYNLKAVLKETGVKADVLRAWERRYGLPMPQRTAGGHRLYSQRDIETIKWLLARQAEGLSISRAVALWRKTGAHMPDLLADSQKEPFPEKAGALIGLEALRNEWLSSCLAFNESYAEQALNQAFALYPVETVCVDLIQRGLAQVGDLWYDKRASVQQEHFTSALALRRLDALLAASPQPNRRQTVLVGCPPRELHTFTALLLALFLRRRGLHVIYLGADVPGERFEETVAAAHADLVVLVAQQLISAATLQQVAASLAGKQIGVAFGGRIFGLQPGLIDRIPGHFLGQELETAVQKIEALLSGDLTTLTQPAPPAGKYAQALDAFVSRRNRIELELDESWKALRISLQYLYTANHFLGENIIAGLRLGELAYLDDEMKWLAPVLAGHALSSGIVQNYLSLYTSAVRHQLGDAAEVITDWLEGQITTLQNL